MLNKSYCRSVILKHANQIREKNGRCQRTLYIRHINEAVRICRFHGADIDAAVYEVAGFRAVR